MNSHEYDAEEVRIAARAGSIALAAIGLITWGMLIGCIWGALELAKAVRP